MDDHRLRQRANIIFLLLTAALVVLIARLYVVQVLSHAHYAEKAQDNHQRRDELEGYRGPIVTRTGRPMAVTRPAAIINADLRRVTDRGRIAAELATLADADEERVLRLLKLRDRSWVELKRNVSTRVAARVRERKLKGIVITRDTDRFYPLGREACHLTGLTSDNRGITAAERLFDQYLHGRPGWSEHNIDGRRRAIVTAQHMAQPPRPGDTVVLTIDATLQNILNEALEDIVEEYSPKAICGVLMDVETSEVLALANRPDFDPNDRRGLTRDQRRNRCITDAFEPGSVFKPFTWSAVLDAGLARTDELIHCENGLWIYRGRRLHDSHGYGRLTMHEGLVRSSNIMAAKLGLRLGPQKLHAYLRGWGFGEPTGIGIPGESAGLLRPHDAWNEIYSMTSIPMGQEVQVTALQLATAYAALGRGGSYLPPRLLLHIQDTDGVVVHRPEQPAPRRVVSKEAARLTLKMLADTVAQGTGRRAQSSRYALGGKTGTAQKAIPGQGYVEGLWVSSFCGVGPAESPRLACVIMVDEPNGAYYGGVVAAPSVGLVLDQALHYLGVPPTKSESFVNRSP